MIKSVKSTLYLYAVDAGAVSVMLPVWAVARQRVHTQWIADGIAVKLLKQKNIPFLSNVTAVLNRCKSTDVFLIGSQMNAANTIDVLTKAKEKNIQLHFIFDHWCEYMRHFSIGKKLVLPTGFVFAIDEMEKKILVKKGIPSKKIKIVGHPAIWESEGRAEILSRSIHEKSNQITFFSEPINADYGKRKSGEPLLGYDERDALGLLFDTLRKLNRKNLQLVIKLHPRENIENMKSFVKNNSQGVSCRFVTKGDPLKMMLSSKYIFGMTTIVLMHALRLGKIVGSLQPNRTKEGKENSNIHLERVLMNSSSDILTMMKRNRRLSLSLLPHPAVSILRHMDIGSSQV